MKKARHCIVASVIAVHAAGCGYKGPLTLPEKGGPVTTRPGTQAPAATAPTDAATTAPTTAPAQAPTATPGTTPAAPAAPAVKEPPKQPQPSPPDPAPNG